MTDKALRKRAGQNNIAIAVWRATECAGVALKGSFVRNVLDAQAKVFLQHSHSSSAPALVIGTFCICMRGWSPPGTGGRFSSARTSLIVIAPMLAIRSDERRVGNECGSQGISRWSPYHYKKKTVNRNYCSKQ